jgi:nuclear transport factor 2 (NTF2) superfamily protein
MRYHSKDMSQRVPKNILTSNWNKTINRVNEITTQNTNFVAIKYSYEMNMDGTKCFNISI